MYLATVLGILEYVFDWDVHMITGLLTFVTLFAMLSAAGYKWELKSKHYFPWSIAMALLGFGLSYGLGVAFPSVPAFIFVFVALATGCVLSVGAIMFFFFRDPERKPPADPRLIVSPADGTVVYVKEVEKGHFPFAVKNNRTIPLEAFAGEGLIPDRGIQIGIAMNYLNVHVNRSPIAGVVKMLHPIPGKFISLKHIHALLENERVLMVFENDTFRVGIVQIASRLVRRIVPYVQEGQFIDQGQRVGMIKFGSQVDLLVPYRADLRVRVKVGDELIAGESVVMTCDPSPPTLLAYSEAGAVTGA